MSLHELILALLRIKRGHPHAKIKMGVIVDGKMHGVENVQLAIYRDPGETNYVAWIHAGKY